MKNITTELTITVMQRKRLLPLEQRMLRLITNLEIIISLWIERGGGGGGAGKAR